MSASFSTWLSVGVGSRGTRRVDSTRALPCQEVSDADCRGNWKRPRLQAGEDLVNRGEQLPYYLANFTWDSDCFTVAENYYGETTPFKFDATITNWCINPGGQDI